MLEAVVARKAAQATAGIIFREGVLDSLAETKSVANQMIPAKGKKIGVDLGTTAVRVYVKGKGIVLREPSVVALGKDTGEVRAVGEEAYRLLGRAPGEVLTVRPLQGGVVADEALLEGLLKTLLGRVMPNRLLGQALGPSVAVCLPAGAEHAQARAVRETLRALGAKAVYQLEAPLAAALGAGLPVTEAKGSMVVDLGAHTTDLAVLSLGGVVLGETLRVAGETFDEAILRTVRGRYGVLIGDRTAEEVKRQLGAVGPPGAEGAPPADALEVRGRDLSSSLPKTATVTHADVTEALQGPVQKLVDGVQRLLETAPAELVADIIERGVTLTGGGAALRGLAARLQEGTGVPVAVAPSAADCTALGLGRALELTDRLQLLTPERTRPH